MLPTYIENFTTILSLLLTFQFAVIEMLRNLNIRFYSGMTGNITAQKYVLTKYFQGEPKNSDFKIVEEKIPDLKDGGKTVYFLSIF